MQDEKKMAFDWWALENQRALDAGNPVAFTRLAWQARQHEIDALNEQVRVLREALGFYADSENYLSDDAVAEYDQPFKGLVGAADSDVVLTIVDAAGQDGGKRARQALANGTAGFDLAPEPKGDVK